MADLTKTELLDLIRETKEALTLAEEDLLKEPDDLDLWLYQEELETLGTNLVMKTKDEEEDPDGEG